MKQKLLYAVAVLLVVASCCGCGETQNTKNFDTITREFTDSLYSEDYATCVKCIDELYQKDITEDVLRDIFSGTTVQFGAFQAAGTPQETTVKEYLTMMNLTESYSPDDYDISVYYQPVTMENGNFGIFFLFNPSTRMICGITVCTETLVSSELAPGYKNDDNEEYENINKPKAED